MLYLKKDFKVYLCKSLWQSERSVINTNFKINKNDTNENRFIIFYVAKNKAGQISGHRHS